MNFKLESFGADGVETETDAKFDKPATGEDHASGHSDCSSRRGAVFVFVLTVTFKLGFADTI